MLVSLFSETMFILLLSCPEKFQLPSGRNRFRLYHECTPWLVLRSRLCGRGGQKEAHPIHPQPRRDGRPGGFPGPLARADSLCRPIFHGGNTGCPLRVRGRRSALADRKHTPDEPSYAPIPLLSAPPVSKGYCPARPS